MWLHCSWHECGFRTIAESHPGLDWYSLILDGNQRDLCPIHGAQLSYEIKLPLPTRGQVGGAVKLTCARSISMLG